MPTFEELFSKLVYRNGETENEYASDKNFLEGDNAGRVENYVQSIEERAQNEPRPPEGCNDPISEIEAQMANLERENEEMKRQIAELKVRNKDARAVDVVERSVTSSQASESNEKKEITPQMPSFVSKQN